MRFQVGERILLTLWVGGLWCVGYIVAPTLFAELTDRSTAGSLAGRLFEIMAWIGLLCGTLLLISNQLRNPSKRANWRALVLVLMLLAVAAGQFVLSPMIADMRIQGLVDSPAFGQLHGLAAINYLAISLMGLLLVISPGE